MKVYHPILLSVLIALSTGQPVEHLDRTSVAPAEVVEGGCGRNNLAFLPGEEVVYKIFYNLSPFWFAAGEVSFKIEDAGNDYRFKVVGFTYKSLEWFYRGIYTFESDVNKKTLMPHQFIRTIEEKKYSRYNKFVFDQNKGIVKTWQGKTKEVAEADEQEVGTCIHDMISVLYYMRNVNFDNLHIGEIMPIDVFLEEKYPLSVRVLAKNEEKRIKGLGKQQTHVFSPEVVAGDVFSEGTQMTIWISADENKIPLMIESPVRIGKVKAVLQEYKGLRYPFQNNED